RLFRIDLKSKKTVRLTENTDRILYFSISPDGRYAFTIHERSLRFTYDNSVKPVNFIYDLVTGKRRQILDDKRFNILQARWTRKGDGLYLANATTSDPRYVIAYNIDLYYYDLAGDSVTKVNLDWDRGLSEGEDEIGCFEVTSDGVIALLA